MKIGILTHYYKSNNYGGMLQAYALAKVLNDMGYDAEQICFKMRINLLSEKCVENSFCKIQNTHKSKSSKLKRFLSYAKGTVLYCKRRKSKEKKEERIQNIIETFLDPRKKAFLEFQDKIPHSHNAYTENTLFLTNDVYDAFITGSDQVFNLEWQSPTFFLEFVNAEKKKIAYAASAGTSDFDPIQEKYLQRVLPSFEAISVREKDLVETYKRSASVVVEPVLDPVLLLGKEGWNEVTSERLVNEPYVFCFFYDPTAEYYKICAEFAKKKNCKIVTIPYAILDTESTIDDAFGDYRIGTASPEDFISLIKHADIVITDSFHCAAFACMFDVPFFAFEREMGETGKKMGSRIVSLTQMFGCEERFCNTKERTTADYLANGNFAKYEGSQYEKMRRKSLEFLKISLG